MAKDYAKQFYNSKAWLQCRAAYISKVFGLCEKCRHDGYIVHHKIEITPDNINDPYITLCHDNLQYLCLTCHNRVDAAKIIRDDVTFDSRGQLIYRPPLLGN